MRNINRPQSYDKFKKYLDSSISDITGFEISLYKSIYEKYIKFLSKVLIDNFGKLKDYSDVHIAERIFILHIRNFNNYLKYNLIAQIRTFKRLYSNIDFFWNKNDFDSILREIKLTHEILTDSIVFINYSPLKVNGQKPQFGIIKTNYVNSYQTYKASLNLFHENIDLGDWSVVAIRASSIFLIRQSIELRLKNALGVNFIINKQGSPVQIGSDLFIEFIKKYDEFIHLPIQLPIVKKIYKWTNYYIHTGIYINSYLIEWAQYIISPLFKAHSDKSGNYLFGSIKINKVFFETQMLDRLKEFIVSKVNIDIKDFYIVRIHEYESLLID